MVKEEKIEAILQMTILIVGVVAFAYFAALFFEGNLVSAEEEDGNPPTEEEVLQGLDEEGYTGEDFSDDDLSDNSRRLLDRLNDETDAGQISALIEMVLNFIGLKYPHVQEIGGELFGSLLEDVSGGIWTCEELADGSICQEITGRQKEELCVGDSWEGRLDDMNGNACEQVFCFDEEYGLCLPRSTAEKCEEQRGKPLDVLPAECVPGCCKLGNHRFFVTMGECRNDAEGLGLEFEGGMFEEGKDEPTCIFEGLNENELGACVSPLDENDELYDAGNGKINDCEFVTRGQCASNIGSGSALEGFKDELLCSNEDLKTVCEKQVSTSCVDGKDEIYWFDSCGNMENIYEGSSNTQRDLSWNNGKIKLKTEVGCQVDDSNRGTCGNCDRFLSSICAEKTGQEKLDDSEQEVVCIDTGCTDANGDRRENGESWCAYQGQIGIPMVKEQNFGQLEIPRTFLMDFLPRNAVFNNIIRDYSADTPGSSHYLVTCEEGEIEKEACEFGRAEICVQEDVEDENSGETTSLAVCRKNRWQQCLSYNPGQKESEMIGKAGSMASRILDAKLKVSCGMDPDCFVKTVDLTEGGDDSFKFSYCAPRFPPGFDLVNDAESATQICKQATATCTEVWVKELGSGWTCKANCKCSSDEFAQQMNDFCISLGDCGYQVNYHGDLPGGKGYSAWEGKEWEGMIPDFSGLMGGFSGFMDMGSGGLRMMVLKDSNPIQGEYIKANSELLENADGQNPFDSFLEGIGDLFNFDIGSMLGFLNGFGIGGDGDGGGGTPTTATPEYSGPSLDSAKDLGMVAGATGAAVSGSLFAGGFAVGAIGGATGFAALETFAASGLGIALEGFGAGALGAAAGMASVAFLIDISGVGRGIPAAMSYGLMAAGGAGGAMVGLSLVLESAAPLGPIGIIVLVATLVIIGILTLFDIGDIEEKEYNFECKPWVKPRGTTQNVCESCGSEDDNANLMSDGSTGFPCNKYACESLGNNCVFVENSENEDGGDCAWTNNDDSTAPRLVRTLEDAITEGFRYYGEEDVSDGFGIQQDDGDCLEEFQNVRFGFEVDEYVTNCRVVADWEPGTTTYEEMIPFGGSGKKQFYTFSSLNENLERIGVDIGEWSEEEDNGLELFFACEDLQENNNAENPFRVEMCVHPWDLTAPLILDRHLNDEEILPYNVDDWEFWIPLNEPAECRWDYEDVSFDEMSVENQCTTEGQGASGRYGCFISGNMIEDTTSICVKCRDHPEWQGTEDEERRNTHSQCKPVTFTRSESNLVIDFVEPKDVTLLMGRELPQITLKVGVSGGVDGTAICSYEIDDTWGIGFFSNGERKSQHEILLNRVLGEGTHTVVVECDDDVNEKIRETVSFEIVQDLEPGEIVRVYVDSGTLVVITSEPATCGFVNVDDCDFSVGDEETTTMLADIDSGSLLHRYSGFEKDKIYYLKCKDHPEWIDERAGERNEPIGCNMVVSGGMV